MVLELYFKLLFIVNVAAMIGLAAKQFEERLSNKYRIISERIWTCHKKP